MLDIKLQSLEKQEKLTPEQAAALRRFTEDDDSAYPTMGERVKLFTNADEAIALLKSKRHSLLEISRSPTDPEQVIFVLRLKSGESAPTKRFGQPRTWLLFGIALGATLNLMVQTLWPKAKPAAPTQEQNPVLIYPSSQK